jgi:hypothetical protein
LPILDRVKTDEKRLPVDAPTETAIMPIELMAQRFDRANYPQWTSEMPNSFAICVIGLDQTSL